MRLREARLKAGKTVQEVKTVLGVTDAAVYLWETDKVTPRLEKLKELAKLYDTTVDFLVSDSQEQDTSKQVPKSGQRKEHL